jgi:hypothetical protein
MLLMGDAVDRRPAMHIARGAGSRPLSLAVSTEVRHGRPAVGAERCSADALMDREISRGRDQRNLRLRGQKGQRYQMCRNTKSKFNDPTVAHGCLLIC